VVAPRTTRLFAGSERGADRAAVMVTLVMTAKPNDVDPQASLASTTTPSTGRTSFCLGGREGRS